MRKVTPFFAVARKVSQGGNAKNKRKTTVSQIPAFTVVNVTMKAIPFIAIAKMDILEQHASTKKRSIAILFLVITVPSATKKVIHTFANAKMDSKAEIAKGTSVLAP